MANANTNDTTKQDIYENYIIRSNVQLQEENAKLKEELKEFGLEIDAKYIEEFKTNEEIG